MVLKIAFDSLWHVFCIKLKRFWFDIAEVCLSVIVSGEQIDCLSSALRRRGGVENVVQTVYPCKCGVIWVPLAKVTLKVSRDLQLENPSKLFMEVYPSKQRILEDDCVILLIPLDKVDNSFDLLVDLLVRYLFLRYKILQLIAGSTR